MRSLLLRALLGSQLLLVLAANSQNETFAGGPTGAACDEDYVMSYWSELKERGVMTQEYESPTIVRGRRGLSLRAGKKHLHEQMAEGGTDTLGTY